MFTAGVLVGGGLLYAISSLWQSMNWHERKARMAGSTMYGEPDPTLDLVFDHNAWDLAFIRQAMDNFEMVYGRKPRRIVIVEGTVIYGLPLVVAGVELAKVGGR